MNPPSLKRRRFSQGIFGVRPRKLQDIPSPWPPAPSKARDNWEHLKSIYHIHSPAFESLMNMVGLEAVKIRLIDIAFRVLSTKSGPGHGIRPMPEELSVAFVGNPETGKSMAAEYYIQFLQENTHRQYWDYKIRNNNRNAWYQPKGAPGEGEHIVLIDNVNNIAKDAARDIANDMKSCRKDTIYVVTASQEAMDIISGESSSDECAIPIAIRFPDLAEIDLYYFFVREIARRFGEDVQFEGFQINGLPTKVLMKRISRKQGMANSSKIQLIRNTVVRIINRHTKRLFEESKATKVVGRSILTKEDFIMSPSSRALEDSEAWQKLQSMIGLKSVKTSVKALIYQLQWNYDRELNELPPITTTTNRVFLGKPGTGKTTVAKLYAQILAGAGLLSSSEVMVKSPVDFIGEGVGRSEENTKKILQQARGKVLVIDEAYMLGNGGHRKEPDQFRAAVIDTLVGEIQGGDNEDRCVLLLGYRHQMEEMFRNTNPGLARRFPMESAFEFEDYTKEELREILELKLTEQHLEATNEAKEVAMEVLERARNSTMFGNAGEVDNLLARARERQLQRLNDGNNLHFQSMSTLEAEDMDGDFDRINRATTGIRELFSGMVASEALVEKLESWQRIVKNAKARDLDPREHIPFNFLFRGPPGTGKTTTARKMGKVFYNLGFLATTEIVECSVSDFIGKYVGHTAPQTRAIFEKALGKVLFIDEAYRLATGRKHNSFASEAVGEMVDILTQERFHNKLVVVLAGYEEDIDKLLASNPGLSSRFPETVDFANLTPVQCRTLLFQSIKSKLDVDFHLLDMEFLDEAFTGLSALPFWGNARDVQTLAKRFVSRTLADDNQLPHENSSRLYGELGIMVEERSNRAANMEE